MPLAAVRSHLPNGHTVFSVLKDGDTASPISQIITNEKDQIIGVFNYSHSEHLGIGVGVSEATGKLQQNFYLYSRSMVSGDKIDLVVDIANKDAVPILDVGISADTISENFKNLRRSASIVDLGDGHKIYSMTEPSTWLQKYAVFIEHVDGCSPMRDVYVGDSGGMGAVKIFVGDINGEQEIDFVRVNHFVPNPSPYQQGVAHVGSYFEPHLVSGGGIDGANVRIVSSAEIAFEQLNQADLPTILNKFFAKIDVDCFVSDVVEYGAKSFSVSSAILHSNSQANKRQEGFNAIMNAFDLFNEKPNGDWKSKMPKLHVAKGASYRPLAEVGEGIEMAERGKEADLGEVAIDIPDLRTRRGGYEEVRAADPDGDDAHSSTAPIDPDKKFIEFLRLAKQKLEGGRRGILGYDFANNFAKAFDTYCEINDFDGDRKKSFATKLKVFLADHDHQAQLQKPSYMLPYDPITYGKKMVRDVVETTKFVVGKIVPSKKYAPKFYDPQTHEVEKLNVKKGLDEEDFFRVSHHLKAAENGLDSMLGHLTADSRIAKVSEYFLPGSIHHAQQSRDYGRSLSWCKALGKRFYGGFIDALKAGNFEDNLEKLGRFTQAGRDLRTELALDELQGFLAKNVSAFLGGDAKEKFAADEINLLKKLHQKLSIRGHSDIFRQYFDLELEKVLAVYADDQKAKGAELSQAQIEIITAGFRKCFEGSAADLRAKELRKGKESFSEADLVHFTESDNSHEFSSSWGVTNSQTLDRICQKELDLMLKYSADKNNSLIRIARELEEEVALQPDKAMQAKKVRKLAASTAFRADHTV